MWSDKFCDFPDWADKLERGDAIREALHFMKDGKAIKLKDMSNKHLWNAYTRFGDEALFKEMVLRMFEGYMKEKD